MKQIYLIIIAAALLMSCSDFLKTENLIEKDSASFPVNAADYYTALMGCYAPLTTNLYDQNPFIVAEVMADYRLGGGGPIDMKIRAINEFKKTSDDMFDNLWTRNYKGINRANFLLENETHVVWDNEQQRKKMVGQAYFLRAYYYLELCRLFGTVPLTTQTQAKNMPKASADQLFGQIASDLKQAIELLPATPISSIPANELGLATKWAAQALMGRAYLFYAGYYKKSEISLPDGGIVNKATVASWIDDCIANSAHKLVNDYRNLWGYSYSNKDYGYAKNNKLQWIGETGANTETVFAIKFSALGSNTTDSYHNSIHLYFGWKNQDRIPFGKGWGFGPVNPMLFREWPSNDLRKKASIIDLEDPDEGISGYKYTGTKQMQETKYWQKKNMPVTVYDAAGKIVNISCELYGRSPNFQYDNALDLVVIRFADVLLMGAELESTQAQKYFDAVRARAGLENIPVSLENIKRERLYELAFEGERYFDLLRWGDIEEAFAKLTEIPIMNEGVPLKVTIRYRPETKGFLQIPNKEINLSDGILTQNEGWIGSDMLYN